MTTLTIDEAIAEQRLALKLSRSAAGIAENAASLITLLPFLETITAPRSLDADKEDN